MCASSFLEIWQFSEYLLNKGDNLDLLTSKFFTGTTAGLPSLVIYPKLSFLKKT